MARQQLMKNQPITVRRTGKRVLWGPGLLAVPGIVLLVIIFVLPLLKLVGDSFVTDEGLSFLRYQDLLTRGTFLDVIWRTVRVSLLVTILCVVIGYPVAYAAARARAWVAFLMIACVVLPLFTSTLVRSYAWRVLLADNGIINDFLLWRGIVESPIRLLYNDISLVVGMTQVLMPMAILPIFAVLKSIDRSLLNAAKSTGASPLTVWRTVTLPLTTKGLAAGASLVFITSLGFYTTPALLAGVSTPMFAQLVESQVNTYAEFGRTTAGAAFVLVGVVVIMMFLRRPLGLVAETPVATSSPLRGLGARLDWTKGRDVLLKTESALSPLRWIALWATALFGIVALMLPQLIIAMLAFNDSNFLSFPPDEYSFRWFEAYFENRNWMQSTALSARVSAIAAFVATLVGAITAFAVVRMRNRRVSTSIYMLSLAPMVLPPILYAVGLFFIFVPAGVVGTEFALVIAYIALGFPYVMITSQAIARDIDPLTERAAASMGATAVRRAKDIIMPLMAPALFASFLLAFIQVFDDLVIALFLGGPTTVTLQMRMYEDIMYEVSPMVAAVGVLLTVATLLLGLSSMAFARRRAKTPAR